MEELQNIFDFLKQRCEDAGTNITEVCKEANVNRQNVEKWKHNNPKTLDTLALLLAAAERLAGKNKKTIQFKAGLKLNR